MYRWSFVHIALRCNHMQNVITFVSLLPQTPHFNYIMIYQYMKTKVVCVQIQLDEYFYFILANFNGLLIYRSSKNITRNSNWRGYHWCPQPINLDMFSRRKPITKIPMAAKTANSAGKKRFHFISNGWGVINQFYMR